MQKKIIVLSTPAEGHVNPLVPIIKKLVEKGYEIVWITGRAFQYRVEKSGASFLPPPPKWDFGHKEAYDIFPELKKKKGLSQIKYYLKHVMIDPVPDVLDMLKNVLENFHASLVISDSFMAAGGWITEVTGLPGVRVSYVPLNLPGKNIPPPGLGLLPGKSLISKLRNSLLNWIFYKLLFRDVQEYANEIRTVVGLPPYDKSIFVKGFESGNLILHTSTPAFEYRRNKFPANFRFIGPIILPPDLEYRKPAGKHSC
jgi:UDP:flavonoid glycosyltransferase YjiC (YdhE family)